jgi:hypothetical protein
MLSRTQSHSLVSFSNEPTHRFDEVDVGFIYDCVAINGKSEEFIKRDHPFDFFLLLPMSCLQVPNICDVYDSLQLQELG